MRRAAFVGGGEMPDPALIEKPPLRLAENICIPLHWLFACFETACSARLLSMRYIFDGIKKTPHPEEPAIAASRRTHTLDPAVAPVAYGFAGSLRYPKGEIAYARSKHRRPQPGNRAGTDEGERRHRHRLAARQRDQLAVPADAVRAVIALGRGQPGGPCLLDRRRAVRRRQEADDPHSEHRDDGIRRFDPRLAARSRRAGG